MVGKTYQGYKVMDEMVYDGIIQFAEAYFKNFNDYVELEFKSINQVQENLLEMGKIQIDSISTFQETIGVMDKLKLESMENIQRNQTELNNKLDLLIEQNAKLICILEEKKDNQNQCPECGNPIPNNAKFCIKCGAKF